MKDEFKSIQYYTTAKIIYKKLTITVVQKSEIITIRNIKAFFQVNKGSELEKVDVIAQKVINALEKPKNLKHKKEFKKCKKFWNIFKTTNQYQTKLEKNKLKLK